MQNHIDFSNIRIACHIEAAREEALNVLKVGRKKGVADIYELGNQNNSLETTTGGAVNFAHKLAGSLAEEKEDNAFFFTNIRSTVRRIRRLLS